MLSIAICDDDIQMTGRMERMIQSIAKANYVDVELEVFWNGKSLVDTISSGENFDIIYLDIEMDKEDGITAAKKIRAYDKNVRIIYVTSHENHMRDSFAVRPFQFLVKPINEKIMEACFKEVYEDINSEDFYFRYSYQRINHKVPIRDILYFESNRRKIFIVTENEVHDNANSLKFIVFHDFLQAVLLDLILFILLILPGMFYNSGNLSASARSSNFSAICFSFPG